MKRITGEYETLGDISYFLPYPLPPHNPDFIFDEELTNLYGTALQELSRLNEVVKRVPDTTRFIKAYVIKEALLSSAIEGIHTTLLDIFTQPLGDAKPNKETQLVLNYTKALDIALSMIQVDGFHIVSRVILKAHEALMQIGEGDKANPGHYRKQSVRVGKLIPPYAQKIAPLMNDLEAFINTDNSLLPLIKAGLVHVQFETIHPFLDGNGRIGRLLIVLMLVESGLLSAPLVYPSYYFKKHHHEYYVYLDRVRTHGDFEAWIKYYLAAIAASCIDAYRRITEIETLENALKRIIEEDASFKKIKLTASSALAILFQFPIITTQALSNHIQKSYNTTNHIIQKFLEHNILVIDTGDKLRNKVYHFDAYLKLLEKEY